MFSEEEKKALIAKWGVEITEAALKAFKEAGITKPQDFRRFSTLDLVEKKLSEYEGLIGMIRAKLDFRKDVRSENSNSENSNPASPSGWEDLKRKTRENLQTKLGITSLEGLSQRGRKSPDEVKKAVGFGQPLLAVNRTLQKAGLPPIPLKKQEAEMLSGDKNMPPVATRPVQPETPRAIQVKPAGGSITRETKKPPSIFVTVKEKSEGGEVTETNVTVSVSFLVS